MKILSEGEFRNFNGFQSMGIKSTLKLVFNGAEVVCTPDHEFLSDDGEWIQAKDIDKDDTFNGYTIQYMEYMEKPVEVFDAINVEETHSFYAEGLTAHNCSLLYIDETAFVEGWDDFVQSVLPTISSGETTKLLYTSTPNGLNHFYSIWQGAVENTNGFAHVFVPWDKVPGRDEAWKKEILEGLNHDLQKFAQEYEVEFQGSSGTLIDGATLKRLKIKQPLVESKNIKQYEVPQEKHQYIITVDVSRGKGLDYSAFSVIDVTSMPYKQVCTFRDNMITPIEYAEILFRMGKVYNEAAILVEVNDIGGQVADALHYDYEYDGILYTESAGRSGKRVSSGFGKNVDRGLRTTKTTKAIGCNMLKLMVEQNQLIINDEDTISELSTFSRKGVSYEAEPGCHDDMVMTMVIFSWLSDQAYFRDITDINTLASLREESEEQLHRDLAPIGIFSNTEDIKEEYVREGGENWMIGGNIGYQT